MGAMVSGSGQDPEFPCCRVVMLCRRCLKNHQKWKTEIEDESYLEKRLGIVKHVLLHSFSLRNFSIIWGVFSLFVYGFWGKDDTTTTRRHVNSRSCPGPDTIAPRDQIPREGNPSLRHNIHNPPLTRIEVTVFSFVFLYFLCFSET